MTEWTHDALLADLAGHLASNTDALIFMDMQLGPAGSPRPDVYRIPKSYSRFHPLAYEIKVSVADFRRDVTAGKWQKYLKFASGVVFATPAGLIDKADLPRGCGLMIRGEAGWRSLKAPTLAPFKALPTDAWIKLVIDSYGKHYRIDTGRSRIGVREWLRGQKARALLGERVCKLLDDLTLGEETLEHEIAHMRKYREEEDARNRTRLEDDIRKARSEVSAFAIALGLPGDANSWQLSARCRELLNALVHDRRTQMIEDAVKRFERAVAQLRLDTEGLKPEFQAPAVDDPLQAVA